MKIQIIRALVLLVSISAASVLVWNATRDHKSKESQEKSAFDPDDMQSSSKSSLVFEAGEVIDIVDDSYFSRVTDEEVNRTRNAMMTTSKSGRIMNDDQIREMLEEQKKEELKYKQKPHLIYSSKSSAMTLEEFLKFVEATQKAKSDEDGNQTPLMHSSKSMSVPIFKPRELEKIIEGEKKDPNAEQGLPPQEMDK